MIIVLRHAINGSMSRYERCDWYSDYGRGMYLTLLIRECEAGVGLVVLLVPTAGVAVTDRGLQLRWYRCKHGRFRETLNIMIVIVSRSFINNIFALVDMKKISVSGQSSPPKPLQ